MVTNGYPESLLTKKDEPYSVAVVFSKLSQTSLVGWMTSETDETSRYRPQKSRGPLWDPGQINRSSRNA